MSFHPQTPQSPSQFSPITTDVLSGASSSASLINTNHSGSSFASAGTSSTLPTPAHSVTGSGFGMSDTAHDYGLSDDSPHNKRKRAIDDFGDQGSGMKKVHMEGQQKLDFEALHQDVGEKYLVCRIPHKPTYPPLSADLFSLFDLTGIAAEVARTLPNGEKNAMRKTYKGYMKKLGVSGHFEPVKRGEGDESDFLHLVGEAEDSWQARQVKTKDIQYGLLEDVGADLRKAMMMNRGPLPKNIWDSSALGDLSGDKLAIAGNKSSSVRGTTPNTPLHPAVARSKSQLAGLPQQQQVSVTGQDSARPRRVNKKRSYGQNSFEGYGEGFPDDDGGEGGYSTGDGDERGPNYKRRKKTSTPAAQYSSAPARQQYGPGVVGA